MMDRATVRSIFPGVLLLAGLATLSRLLGSDLPSVNPLVIAIGLGLVLTNLSIVPERFHPGIGTYERWLELGIVLLGARISLALLTETSALLVVLVLVTVAGTIGLAEWLASHVFEFDRKLGSLLAAGSGICGASAIVAVAGGIRATDDQIAYALATILAFDLVTLVAYPIIGSWLSLSAPVFGTWAGLSMFSTGPVIAAGLAFSDVAAQWATVTKLARNTLLGVVVVGYSMTYLGDGASLTRPVDWFKALWHHIPPFVLGFFLLVVVANTGVLSAVALDFATTASGWCFTLTFVGLGFQMNYRDLTRTGLRPVAFVLMTFLVVSGVTLLLATFLLP